MRAMDNLEQFRKRIAHRLGCKVESGRAVRVRALTNLGPLGFDDTVYEFRLKDYQTGARLAWTWGADDDGPVVTEDDLGRIPPIDSAQTAVEMACAGKLGRAINQDD